jgi:glycosyltransferase involved in cell wall biosynthesis
MFGTVVKMRVAAVVAARNAEVHIARCVADLIADGIEVVVIDHDSEDRSVEIAKGFLGHGLLSIERLPWTGIFALKEQLAAKARVMAELPHDWLIHVDVDEWLQSPWPNTRLIDAIKRVDGMGFNCINFDEMTFVAWPDEDFWRPDYSQLMTTYYFFQPSKLRLMRA